MALPSFGASVSVFGKDRNGDACSANCISVSGSLTEGIAPNAFTVETAFADDETPIPVSGVTLSFTDGVNDTCTFSDMRLDPDSTRVNRSTTGVSVSLSYIDKRWRWAFSDLLDMTYNARDETGTIIEKQKTLTEILTEIGAAMGEAVDLSNVATSGSDEWLYPFVQFEMTPAQNAMSDLCEKYGLRICIDTAGSLKIYPHGGGSELQTTAVRAYSLGVGAKPRPKNIKIYGGKNWYQKTFDLEPVIQDVGGEWKTYDEVSYKPTNGQWTFAIIHELQKLAATTATDEELEADLEEGETPIAELSDAEKDAKKAAITASRTEAAYFCEKTLFRCYRLKDETFAIGDLSTVEMGDDGEPTVTGGLTREQAAARWLDHLVETETTPEGEVQYKRPFGLGTYNTRREIEDANSWDTFYERRVDVRQLDKRAGIVWFSEPLVKILFTAGSGDWSKYWKANYLSSADLKLTAAYEAERFTWDGNAPVDDKSDFIAKIFAEEIRYEYTETTVQNITKMYAKLQKIVADEQEKYYEVASPKVTTYGGILQYLPDGNIESVQWQVGANTPPETVVAYGVSFRGHPRRALRAALQSAGRTAAGNVAAATASRPNVNSIQMLSF
jgi:hypothetical protein